MVFLVLIFGEISVPVIAETVHETPWHRHHIIERYGLLTIIVLGELILSAANSIAALYGHFGVNLYANVCAHRCGTFCNHVVGHIAESDGC